MKSLFLSGPGGREEEKLCFSHLPQIFEWKKEKIICAVGANLTNDENVFLSFTEVK